MHNSSAFMFAVSQFGKEVDELADRLWIPQSGAEWSIVSTGVMVISCPEQTDLALRWLVRE